MDGVAVKLRGDVYRLESELHDSSYASAERHDPGVIAGGSPVGGDDWRGGEVPTFFHIVVDEPLEEELVHSRFIEVGVTSYRPDVVCQKPNRPTRGLH